MSGGVDSSVAAYLLKQAGHEVVGLHMHVWCEERQGRGAQRRQCCNADDVRDAERVCRCLGMPFYVLNLEREFEDSVVRTFCEEYARGRTPNPCLACNERLKFGLLLDRALELGGACLATGHYARVDDCGGLRRLLSGVDEAKDQSYFLYMLSQRQLAHLQFPVGGMRKGQVRRIAREAGLPVAEKPDSVEVCFVPDGDYRGFVASRASLAGGDIVDLEGRVLGRHQGLARYTVGQRHGMGLGGGVRLYVVDLDAANARLIIGPEAALYRGGLLADSVSWVAGAPPCGGLRCTARVRYRSRAVPAVVQPKGREAVVHFDEPQRAIAPGQSVVFYAGEEVLGGGLIRQAIGGMLGCTGNLKAGNLKMVTRP